MSILSALLSLRASKQELQDPIVEAKEMDHDELMHMAELLEEHHESMTKIMNEVRDVVQMLPSNFSGMAMAYWVPHIMIALGGEHGYMASRYESTMSGMIQDIKDEAEASKEFDERESKDDQY